MSEKPKFSIIVACFNSERYIFDALASVKNQTLQNYELIIIDGGSTDGTIGIIEKNFSAITKHIISEKDEGIGDAWNKGLKIASGEFVLLLNSDDFWPPEYLESIATESSATEKKVVYYGSTTMVDDNKNTLSFIDKKFSKNLLCIGFRFIHTSCIIPKSTYELVGQFDKNVRIAVDTDWLLRAHNAGVPFKKLSHNNFMRIGGVSDKHKDRAFSEYISRARHHNILKLPAILYTTLMKTILFIKK
ncbi:glycosyltransferase family 2 protein [Metapseudomonas boanensis]|uniref:Glycosyltransferase n=1 Tax=Metapseudomonas boanensis TaxID=2822138 RepID=A0ABS5XEY3_9GAMM|nr:glycosyltransferase family 2 protein [Pseudomonas boanensis]MBT8765771.1 glycosyltransferase [Pseudomonas boanensis]